MTTLLRRPERWGASVVTRVHPLFERAAVAPTRVGWRNVTAAVLVIIAGTAVSVLRQPGLGALDTIWAEDGSIFLTDAVSRSPLGAVATSYAGYYHLIPRLLAGVAGLFPATAAATVLALMAAACTSAFAVLVYVASAGHLTSRVARVAAAAVVVVFPVAQDDLPNAIANLHWFGLYALFWVLLWTPSSRAGRIVAATVVVLVGGSDILILGFIPLALARWWSRRDRYSALLAGLLTAALVVQVSGLLTGTSSRALEPDPVRSVTGYLFRAVPAAIFGERWFHGHVGLRWLSLAALAWVLVAAAVVTARFTRLTRPNWALAATAAVYSVIMYAMPVALGGVTSRYQAVPAMLIVTALVALLQPGPEATRAVPLWAFAALLAVTCATNLRVDNERAQGPAWHEVLAQARHTCATGSSTAVDIQLSPATKPGLWRAHLPCGYVGRT